MWAFCFHVLLPQNFLVNGDVSLHAFCTQMTDRFTVLDVLQAETINLFGAVCSTCVKRSPAVQSRPGKTSGLHLWSSAIQGNVIYAPSAPLSATYE